MLTNFVKQLDRLLTKTNLSWGSRLALAVVFVWFGLLKVMGLSPADSLVEELHRVTLSSIVNYETFFVVLGVVEVVIGILFLIPRLTGWAILIFLVQMFTTFGPLIFLPELTWEEFGAPSLTGQYIIKNLVLVMLGLNVYYHSKH